jgi:carbonic anhydrase/acetyltransferase-like protein (isoleucine patch superfamily)
MPIYELGDDRPTIADSAWIAPSADVIGRVEVGEGSTVWFNAVLRGDTDLLHVGDRTSIQDGSVLHADAGSPLHIGNDVTVGHQVMLHGCTIGDGSLIGIQSVILNRSRIGRNCLVGAGSLIGEGKEFPDGMLILGSPAKAIRPLTPEQLEGLQRSAKSYVANGQRFNAGLNKIG